MKKTLTAVIAVVSAIAMLGSVAVAGKPADSPDKAKNVAAKQCKDLKKADKAVFKALYGKRAMRSCIKGESIPAETEFKNAAKECKAERKADSDAFRDEYGTKKGKNALGKCVSSKVKDSEEEPAEATPAV